MDSKISSSFIPKDTGSVHIRRPQSSSGLVDIFVLGSVVLLVASVALGVAVFLYSQYVETSYTSKAEQLNRAQEAFEPALIAELTRLDDRMKAAQVILDAHIAPSALFHMLESITLKNVSFRSFSFQTTDANFITMSLSGVARSVNSIALQADLFGQSAMIVSPIFSNINRTIEGVFFDVTADLNPDAVRYSATAPQGSGPGSVGPVQDKNTEEDTSIPIFAP